MAAFDAAGTNPAMLVIEPPPVDWPGCRRGSAPPRFEPAGALAGGALNGGDPAGPLNWAAAGEPACPPNGGALAGADPAGELNGDAAGVLNGGAAGVLNGGALAGAANGGALAGVANGGALAGVGPDCLGPCFPAQAGSTGASAGL
ncbi:hypothetical protein [Actinoplanes philippinensis]|uniref:hypothetical protein n=1 Tax=Actinoplanes philippinensis TaxID=35752 RepID=UPI0033DBF365